MEQETVWLTASQMAVLFGRDVKTIYKHINNALREELDKSLVVANFASTKKYGRREGELDQNSVSSILEQVQTYSWFPITILRSPTAIFIFHQLISSCRHDVCFLQPIPSARLRPWQATLVALSLFLSRNYMWDPMQNPLSQMICAKTLAYLDFLL